MVSAKQVLEALQRVQDPELRQDLVTLGMVHDIQITGGRVSFTLALTTLACPLRGQIVEEARAAVAVLEGVEEVQVNLREMSAEEKRALFPSEEGVAASRNHIRRVVAVMSGKGGVGKSLVAGMLAASLRRQGYRVGVLDADITGPSIPRLFFPHLSQPQGGPLGIIPAETAQGILVISINLLLPREDDAVIWRGPMISRAIQQFWGDVLWGDLDLLVVDLPPGTSDAALTVLQSLPLDGVVMVTSPQRLAGMVVRKAARMVRQLGVRLLGLVENMSYVLCPGSQEPFELFGPSHAREIAVQAGVPLLGRLPIDPRISTLGDEGRLEEYLSEPFEGIAGQVAEQIGLGRPGGRG